MTNPTRAEIGVIGGSGFYTLFGDRQAESESLTPYGKAAGPVIGEIAGRRVAFLPRHGADHGVPPHKINYRANLWSLRALGVRQILAPCAVGSLHPELGPGSIVIPDQLVDRTSGRVQTYYDSGAVHVPFADPYCPAGRHALLKSAASIGTPAHDGATMVVVEGPRFSTRAESRWYADAGWSLINMTGHPEAVLARELGQLLQLGRAGNRSRRRHRGRGHRRPGDRVRRVQGEHRAAARPDPGDRARPARGTRVSVRERARRHPAAHHPAVTREEPP